MIQDDLNCLRTLQQVAAHKVALLEKTIDLLALDMQLLSSALDSVSVEDEG